MPRSAYHCYKVSEHEYLKQYLGADLFGLEEIFGISDKHLLYARVQYDG